MIRSHHDQGLSLLTIDRPDKANSLTAALLRDLHAGVEEARRRKARALVLTGTGRVFSAGADLTEAQTGTLATAPEWEALSGALASLPCLTIAALNGTLAGGAFGMALACDIRLAVPGARFFYPVMRLGFLPQPNDPARLVRLVGSSRARMILLGGARIDAAEALAWGLVDRILPEADLHAAALALAADALAATPAHVAAIKAMHGPI
ncbi:enoyl-CoA hydratase/isomerase family protein [Paracoccus liaowanqingii]|uniref:Enoyl-CoA hydratase/isomerase family protein n=1 Tax=Paracoccus liaowanqingii TaxID=2560053 RepID=A0A4Z1BJQ3_9RHOB|nr:enoyl-CoA hydratase/isomerase family protein [Paracoccus liaowanqingii]TGN57851.1 enoyl-CoA hydratase/isomerase family protein [Paracoccus liaowanqingii]